MLVQIRYSKQIGIWKFNNTKTNYEKRNEIKHKYIIIRKERRKCLESRGPKGLQLEVEIENIPEVDTF